MAFGHKTFGYEFRVNENRFGRQSDHETTALVDGGYVVIWKHSGNGASVGITLGQVYNQGGTPHGSYFSVRPTGSASGVDAHVTSTADGGFIVAMTYYLSGSPEIVFQFYDANGVQQQSSRHVANSFTDGYQYMESIEALTDIDLRSAGHPIFRMAQILAFTCRFLMLTGPK